MNMRTPIRAIVVGASGYSGAELVALLCAHPCVELAGVFGSSSRAMEPARPLGDAVPALRGICDLELRPWEAARAAALEPEVVFLATPHEFSHEVAPELLRDAGGRCTVIDLSAAFRLKDAALYPRHYGFAHEHPDLLAAAVYGLPELDREPIASADLIAAPGCYPTGALLAIAPIIRAGLVSNAGPIVIDATSGVSGAGRALKQEMLFCEVGQRPYAVFSHRHQPEIRQGVAASSGKGIGLPPIVFTPHVGPYPRGILSTIHLTVAQQVRADDIAGAYREAFEREVFVRLRRSGDWPSVNDVVHTNFCDIAWAVDESIGHLIVVSAIDNLVKGAAGQALQCMNIRFGLPETAGLLPAASRAEGARL